MRLVDGPDFIHKHKFPVSFLDSGAPEDTCCIPEVRGVSCVANWLSIDAYEDMARDTESIPGSIEQVQQECCMCIYSKV